MIVLTTNHGEIHVELDFKKAPTTAANFQKYVEDGYYDGTIFHRVISDFMIQGGGFLPGLENKENGEAIQNEADNGLTNDIGTLAMARTGEPHSATSQFFINVADNNFLNHSGKNPSGWGYAVFGKVISGMDVVDEIKNVETGSRDGHQDVPLDDIEIQTATCVDSE
jgi:peptidyl-prolyl cis-trans isomerase B (cyclophilin B)